MNKLIEKMTELIDQSQNSEWLDAINECIALVKKHMGEGAVYASGGTSKDATKGITTVTACKTLSGDDWQPKPTTQDEPLSSKLGDIFERINKLEKEAK